MEKDYQMFLHQLAITDEPDLAYFVSGSVAELPFFYTMQNISDTDMMLFSRDRCAISTEDFIPEAFKGTVYFIENIPDCPGYVRLRTGCKYLNGEEFFKFKGNLATKGPSYEDMYSLDRRRINSGNKTSPENRDHQHMEISADYVQCMASLQWPLQAKEWATRKRTKDWPSKDIIARIVDDGCHLVRKSHPNCSDDNEMFRFSFSKAEIILIRTWNPNQLYIYHLIRTVKKDLEMKWRSENHKSAICTYYFKTLMLWACEEKCTEFWNDCNIESSLTELLIEMIEWLIEKRCPHYFIPEYNMLDHLQTPDFDFEKEIRDILEVAINLGFLMPKTQNSFQNINFAFAFPNKLLVLLQLIYPHSTGYLQTSNRECLRSPSTSDSYTYLPLVREEFRDLYLGISEQYRFVTKFNTGLYLSKASRYLNRAVMDDRRYSVIEINLCRSFEGFLEGIHGASDPNQQKSGRESCCKSELRTQRNIAANEGILDPMFLEQNRATIVEGSISDLSDVVFTMRSTPEWEFNLFGYLRLSFGVSASYLANFHYSTRKDYDLANRICEEASTKLANDFFENSDTNSDGHTNDRTPLYLILNNKLVVLFDQQIQTVFGFVALVKGLQWNEYGGFSRRAHLSEFSGQQLSCDKSVSQIGSRIFCRLIPLEFLNYVRYRCQLQKFVFDVEHVSEKKHVMPTRPDFYDSSSVILYAAARISI